MDPGLRQGDGFGAKKLASLRFKLQAASMAGGYVYIMTNATSGTLYIGVTADIAARVTQHREGSGSDFCKRYGLDRLVYIERHERIEDAIAREKALKNWKRSWKLDLIEKANPDWSDLYLTINA